MQKQRTPQWTFLCLQNWGGHKSISTILASDVWHLNLYSPFYNCLVIIRRPVYSMYKSLPSYILWNCIKKPLCTRYDTCKVSCLKNYRSGKNLNKTTHWKLLILNFPKYILWIARSLLMWRTLVNRNVGISWE